MLTNNDKQTIKELIANQTSHLLTKDDAKQFLTKDDAKQFLTKDDAKHFLTKDDAKNFLTKEDATQFLNKDDAKQFATKSDIHELKEEIGSMKGMLQQLIVSGDASARKETDKEYLDAVRDTRIERHDRQIGQLAENAGVVLVE